MREYHRIYHINNRERILVQHAAWRAAKRAAEALLACPALQNYPRALA